MKIILPGDPNLIKIRIEAPKVFTCQVCNCVFEATKDEYHIQDACRNEIVYYCKCPTCGTTAILCE